MLISQARHWIYVTFASYHNDYLDYLDNAEGKGKITPNSFLKMQTYGPWRVGVASELKRFATLIVAVTLLAQHVA
jgi:hypothetical protein